LGKDNLRAQVNKKSNSIPKNEKHFSPAGEFSSVYIELYGIRRYVGLGFGCGKIQVKKSTDVRRHYSR
jgi:hypothetical protein